LVKISTTALILTSCVIGPYVYSDVMEFHRPAVRFMMCLPHFVIFFKTLEAFFGFTPAGAKSSFWIFHVYFSNAVELEFDEKTIEPVKSTWSDVFQSARDVIFNIGFNSILTSFMSAHGFKPFGLCHAGKFYDSFRISEYLDPRHLGNCFLIAVVLQQGLAVGDSICSLIIQSVYGMKVQRNMNNPLLESTSPSDFWGRRWNLMVHGVLKRGMYKPIRRYSSSTITSIATFMASGILHEWIVHSALMYHRIGIPDESLYKPDNIALGTPFAFFLWNGIVISIEKKLGRFKFVHYLSLKLPRPVVALLILMSSLPFGMWFADPYYEGRLFWDQEGLLWTIIKIDSN